MNKVSANLNKMPDVTSVLLIEDDNAFCGIVKKLLHDAAGDSVKLHRSGSLSSGLERLSMGGIDVILLDIGLPDSDGLDTIKKAHAEASEIPIVILTGIEDKEIPAKALRLGAQDYFFKGNIQGDSLLRSLHYAIERNNMFVELKNKTRMLLASEARFRKIIEKNADAIVIVDKNKIVRFLNLAAESLFEYKSEEFIGEIFEYNLVAGETIEVEILSKNKKRSVVEIRAVETEWEGEGAYLASLRDITERREAEDERAFFSTAIDQAAEIIFITNTDGIIKYVNPAFERITGYTCEEAAGKLPSILKSGKHEDAFYKDMWDTIEKGDIWRGCMINKKKNGSLYEEEATISPLVDDAGKIVNYVAIKRDVTKEVLLEKQIQQSQKMEAIGTLAGGIAHDLNNILTGIMGYSEITRDMVEVDSEIWGNLNQVINSGHRAKDLIKQILTFSRRGDQEFQNAQLHLIVKEALKLLRASLPSTIEIEQDIDCDSGAVMADLTQMHQMIMNLCANAEQAMREKGGVVRVVLKSARVDADFASIHPDLHEGDYVKLTITDTGHGMDKTTLERIFDPFFTTRGVGEGTGMGLATVHGIVASHGGEIIVQSEKGRGTTFEIYFPAVGSVSKEETALPEIVPKGSERILLVDDEILLAKMTKRMLENLGYNVEEKTNSLEALETFKSDPQKFDLVITDQTMPNMTGDLLAKELMRVRPDIPVILCTGFSHNINSEKAKAIGIKDFIMKPFVTGIMAWSIRKVLDGSE